MAQILSTEWWIEQQILAKSKQDTASQVMAHGVGLAETWTGLAYQKEPEDLFSKIVWWAGVLSQLVVSTATFPAAIGSFLLEESAQSAGMGAYLLYTAKAWTPLSTYIKAYQASLVTFGGIAANLALVNPIAGGAVIVYMEQAKLSAAAMEQAMIAQLHKEARTLGIPNYLSMDASELIYWIDKAESEQTAKDIEEANKYGTLALKSTPTYADIYIDGVSTGLQTPETFKDLSPGDHEVAVSIFDTKKNLTFSYAATIEIEPARKKEVTLHIVKPVDDDLINPGGTSTDDTSQAPAFIKTTVTVAKMIDGDTFETITGERIRILGMDAPESGQPIAEESKIFMEGKLVDHKVEINIQTHLPIDTYGRTLATVTYRDENVAVSSIANGLAKALIFDDATYDPTRYLEAETLAKTRKVGIWNPATPGITWRGI